MSLEDGRMLITGGLPSSQKNKVWFYDDQNGFTPGPDMLDGRVDHACSTFKSARHQQREVALVAGGYKRDDVEVLDEESLETAAPQAPTTARPLSAEPVELLATESDRPLGLRTADVDLSTTDSLPVLLPRATPQGKTPVPGG